MDILNQLLAILAGMQGPISDFLIGWAQTHPWWGLVVVVMGVARAVFKPLLAVWVAYAESTPSASDDAVVASFQHGKIYFFLDWLFSIKLPAPQAPVVAQPVKQP